MYNQIDILNSPLRCFVDGLPSELIIRVLSFCGYKNAIVFASTCKRFWDILLNSTELQLYIELEANKLQLASNCTSEGRNDLPTLMGKLKRYRDAWLDLDLGLPVERNCGEYPMLLWELRDGVFAKAFADPRHSLKPDSLLLIPLGVQKDSTSLSFNVTFSEFTMDIGQELIVLTSMEDPAFVIILVDMCYSSQLLDRPTRAWIRLCSSVTGLAHPQARYPILIVELGFQISLTTRFNIILEINDDLIAIKFGSSTKHKYELLIWNWKTGALLNRIHCDTGIASFAFLDSNHLIVWSACYDDPPVHHRLSVASLLVYKVGSPGPYCAFPENGVFDLSSFPKLAPLFVFQFPRFQKGLQILKENFLLRSNYDSQGNVISLATPFINPRAVTLGLTMTISRDRLLQIFVDTSSLLEHMARMMQAQTSKLSWEQWGEHSTRWFDAVAEPSHWSRCMFGSRYIMGNEDFSVVDFNPATTLRFWHRRQAKYLRFEHPRHKTHYQTEQIGLGHWPDWLHVGNTDMWSDELELNNKTGDEDRVIVDVVTSEYATNISYFDEPVTSRLPYRIVTKAWPRGSHVSEGWMISGDRLIGVGPHLGYTSRVKYILIHAIGDSDEILGDL